MNTTPTFRPLLFSTGMVRAIIENRKSMTRRTRGLDKINQDPGAWYFQSLVLHTTGRYTFAPAGNYNPSESDIIQIKCPYGKPGDILWVREAWQKRSENAINHGFEKYCHMAGWHGCTEAGWKPSIHMPKEAARFFLQVEEIRLERLHDINEGDAFAEGVDLDTAGSSGNGNVLMISASYVSSFKKLWNKINDPGSWETNPWVWVISFKTISKTGCPDFLKPHFFTPSK